MDQFLRILQKIGASLLNTRAAGVYLVLFAAAIGIATFVENDFGTSAAQQHIFKARWFELLLVLFAGSILRNIIKFRMIPQKRWSLLTFHLAILIILVGAAVTRYAGYEGMMHIRENSASNRFLSSDTYLNFEVQKNGQRYAFDEPVLFSSLGSPSWEESYLVDGDLITARVKEFIPNPVSSLRQGLGGAPTIKVVTSGAGGREEYFLRYGEQQQIRDLLVTFGDQPVSTAFNIGLQDGNLVYTYPLPMTRMVMATQQRDTVLAAENPQPLAMRALYSDGLHNLVFPEFLMDGVVSLESTDRKVRNESMTALVMDLSINGNTQQTTVYGSKGRLGQPASLSNGGVEVSVSYGSKYYYLPFSLHLHDFVMEKYPGTSSASSYASSVQLIDEAEGVNEPFRIYMNHILNYGGYRFFQSSFDRDEAGTYLSVNHDFWGSLISYIGYALLTIGMLMTFFSKRTRFYQVNQKIKKLRAEHAAVLLLFLGIGGLQAQTSVDPAWKQHAVDAAHAEAFSEVIVQDFRGRMKPVHTLSREFLRKVARKSSFEGLTADQVFLSLFVNSREWYDVPMIKLGKHEKIRSALGVIGEFATYNDFFVEDGSYKLREEVRRVYGMDNVDRGVYEKELLKVDERLNLMNMAFGGQLLVVFPIQGSPGNTWISYRSQNEESAAAREQADNFFRSYGSAIGKGIGTGDYGDAYRLLNDLKDYQQTYGGEILPSKAQVSAEIFLNQINVFTRLALLYLFLALASLGLLFFTVFRPEVKLTKVQMGLLGLVGLGFLLHTVGLGVRWYVSERAPWSNGYESLIYIAWTTTLAGVLFTRKSFGGLAATCGLAATILFVAALSSFDPEITPLVPVLKSYWLTIHVSLEAGSYGFLMLGAIIGLINLIMMALMTDSNKLRVKRIVTEMTLISELTLLGGLFMVSIGTYLGGVWANESWGRYWGWDAKETWALVTILVYAFILHMRIIPKMTGMFAYNLATIVGLASVLMTYFGVNYYLSGLHSYASGDPVPVPNWVYGAVVCIAGIAVVAFLKKRKHKVIR